MTKALFLEPARCAARRSRARFLETSYRHGRPVTIRMVRRVRPQDAWTSGKFTASRGSARRRALCGREWSPLAESVSDRLVGTERQGAVVFSLRDGAEVSVDAAYARVVRGALAAAPTADADDSDGR